MNASSEVDLLELELATAQAEAMAADSTSIGGAAQALNWPVADVERALKAGRLIAFHFHGKRLLPRWQLGNESAAPLPSVPDLAQRFGNDTVALTAWVRAPNPHLHGRSPSEALAAGEEERVRIALAALGAAAF
jgi:hypothetical protein